MTSILILLEQSEKLAFQNKVGKGNVSSVIRQFILSSINDGKDEDEVIIKEKFNRIEKKKKELDEEYMILKGKVDLIDQKKIMEETRRKEEAQKEEKKMMDIKYQTIRNNLYRVV